jgi:O-antigen/teichoic acid export membrane protein
MARAVGVLAGGTFVGQGLVFLLSPVISRLYSRDDFAVLGLFGSFLSIAVVASSLSYERAINLPESDDEAADILRLSLILAIGTAVLLAVLLPAFGPPLARATGVPQFIRYMWLLPLSLLGAGVYQGLNYWAVRRRAFPRIARTKLTQALGQILTQIGFGLAKVGGVGLLLGDVVSRISGSSTLFALAKKDDGIQLFRFDRERLRAVARRYREMPLYATPAALAHTSASVLPTVLMGALYGSDVMGSYSFGQRIITGPFTVIGVAFAQVFISRSSELARENPVQLRHFYLVTLKRLFLLGLVPIAVILLGGAPLFRWVFGPQWVEAGVYMQILSVALLIQFAVGPVFTVLTILERQKWLLAADLAGLILIVGALYGSHQAGLPPRAAMGWYGGALSMMYILLGWLAYRAIQERVKAS